MARALSRRSGASLHALGGWAVLNHPYALVAHLAYDWTSRDYDAIEIWNGPAGYDDGDAAARRAWLCDLALGRPVVAVGGSDCHEAAVDYPGTVTSPALGAPTTSVLVRSLDWTSVATALRAGRVVVHSQGSFLALWAANETGTRAVTSGDTLRLAAGREAVFELDGVAAAPSTVTLWRTAAGSCTDLRRPSTSALPELRSTELHRVDVGVGPFRVSARVRLDPGVAFAHAELHARGAAGFESDVAITNAVRCE